MKRAKKAISAGIGDRELAYRELVTDLKMQAANRIYSRGRMFAYLQRRFGSSEAVLTRVRVHLRDVQCDWPYGTEKRVRYVKRVHAGVLEELVYDTKAQEAAVMFGSVRRMRRYLLRTFESEWDLLGALLWARRHGVAKTYKLKEHRL